MTGCASRPPDVPALLGVLEEHRVSYVLVGSAAALAYGVEGFTPGGLDIVPDAGGDNPARLAEVLDRIEASPEPVAVRWEMKPDGEHRWVEEEMTPETRAKFEHWTPDSEDKGAFDYLFRTRLGNLDVVPEIAGSYERLIRRAASLSIRGREVRVAHIDDLLARLAIPRRKKDGERVRRLRSIQAERADSRSPKPIR